MLNLNLTHLMDAAKCYEAVRQMRWKTGVCCPQCERPTVIKRGKDDTQAERQRYHCKRCGAHFDDLTDTIFAGHHQPLRMWLLCLSLMGLNLFKQQIAQALDRDQDVVQAMTTPLRQGMAASKPAVRLAGEVACDEVYVTAGHKGKPEAVKKRGAKDGVTALKGCGAEARSNKSNRRFSA